MSIRYVDGENGDFTHDGTTLDNIPDGTGPTSTIDRALQFAGAGTHTINVRGNTDAGAQLVYDERVNRFEPNDILIFQKYNDGGFTTDPKITGAGNESVFVLNTDTDIDVTFNNFELQRASSNYPLRFEGTGVVSINNCFIRTPSASNSILILISNPALDVNITDCTVDYGSIFASVQTNGVRNLAIDGLTGTIDPLNTSADNLVDLNAPCGDITIKNCDITSTSQSSFGVLQRNNTNNTAIGRVWIEGNTFTGLRSGPGVQGNQTIKPSYFNCSNNNFTINHLTGAGTAIAVGFNSDGSIGGLAQAVFAAGTLVTEAKDTQADDYWIGGLCTIVAGTGIGQTRSVSDWDLATKTLTISPDWTITPDATSEYEVSFTGFPVVINDNNITYEENADGTELHAVLVGANVVGGEISYNKIIGNDNTQWGIVVKAYDMAIHHNIVDSAFAMYFRGSQYCNIFNNTLSGRGTTAFAWNKNDNNSNDVKSRFLRAWNNIMDGAASDYAIYENDADHYQIYMDYNCYNEGTHLALMDGADKETLAEMITQWNDATWGSEPLLFTDNDINSLQEDPQLDSDDRPRNNKVLTGGKPDSNGDETSMGASDGTISKTGLYPRQTLLP